MISIGSATQSIGEFINHLWLEFSDILHHSPGIKMGITGASVGTATTTAAAAASVSWVTIIGLCLTGTSVLIALGSLYLGYLNYKERVRENNLKRSNGDKDG